MSETAEWVAWVAPARKGDAAAAEQLTQYFAPFVHAVLLSRLAHRVAGRHVKEVLTQAIYRLGGLKDDAGFGSWVLMAARERAFDAAKAPGTADEAHPILAKIRALAEAPRERLLMRLLEGVPGFEISAAMQVSEPVVRGDLERAAATLVQQLTGQAVAFAGDSYLWSLVGTPHPSLIPLENELTPLRYDAANDEDRTPSAPAIALPQPKPLSEGHRPTGQGPVLNEVKESSAASKGPRGSGPVLNEVKESSAATGGPRGSSPALKSEITDPSGPELQTEAHRLPPPPVPSRPMPEPPANPFGTAVKTIHVSDLPAAADFADLQDVTRPEASEPEEMSTLVQALPPNLPRPARSKSEADELRSKPKGKSLPPPVDHSVEEQPTALRPVGAWKSATVVGLPAPLPTVMGLPAVVVKPGSVTRSWRPFAVAIAFAAIALGVALLLFDGTNRRVRAGWTMVPVVVASTDLTEGTLVSAEMLSQRAVPEQFITSSVIKPDSAQYVVNQKILFAVQAGDPLLWSQFESTHGTERLSKKVMRRARAYDLMTSKSIAVGGWVQPGDRIDIIASLKANEKGQRVAVTLLQNIPVLSTGRITTTTLEVAKKDGDKDYIDVSVLLLPEEAEIVALATEVGDLQFTLRHGDDADVLDADERKGSSSKTLLQGERVKLLQQKRFKTIQQIRKTK